MEDNNSKSKILKIAMLVCVLIAAFSLYFFTKEGQKEVIDLESDITKSQDQIRAVPINNKEVVQVRFSWEVGGIKYNDALYFDKEEYEKMTREQIEVMKEERVINWANTVNYDSKQK